MPTNHDHEADPTEAETLGGDAGIRYQRTVRDAPTSWYRRPRHLVLLALAAVGLIAGVLFVINRDGGTSERGSATAKVGSAPNKTITDYLSANGITQTPVRPGEPGAPVLDIPVPPGWSDAGADTPSGAFAEWLYDDAVNPDDVPFVDFLISRLDGAADPAKVLEFAPGELRNLPSYKVVSEPMTSRLSGFEAIQLSGLYTKNGEERIIAQKTVVIPSANGLFVLQMNADAPKGEASVIQQVTALIDIKANVNAVG